MQLELFRDGADGVGFGALLHCRLPIANCQLKTKSIGNRQLEIGNVTPIPSLLSDYTNSSASTCAATPSSLPRSPSAKRLALPQTDRRAHSDHARTARRGHASETFVPTVCRAECATALCRLLSAPQSSRPARLP